MKTTLHTLANAALLAAEFLRALFAVAVLGQGRRELEEIQ